MTDTNQKLREALRIAVNYIDMDALYTSAGGDHDTIKEALALPTADHLPDAGEMIETAAPEMPLSMNQFGRLVELTREHLTDNTFVYKATSTTGDTCHFGVESAAKAWAKGGTVEPIKVREFKLHTSGPTADHLPDARVMIETAAPVGEREAFENEMRHVDVWGHRSLKKRASGNYENWQVNLMWAAWQARAALSAAAEREECAKVCEEMANPSNVEFSGIGGLKCAAAIRARGDAAGPSVCTASKG